MKKMKGIAASTGIAIAKAYMLDTPDLSFEKETIELPATEISRLDIALTSSIKELEGIQSHTKKTIDEEHAEIFAAHILMLKDPEFIGSVKETITKKRINAEAAFFETATSSIQSFEQMDNPHMRERAADITDVRERVLAHLLGVSLPNPALIDEEVILIAEDLTPSDTAQLNRTFIQAFATDKGGRTSHSAIMARSLEIPAVVGIEGLTDAVTHGDVIIVDGIDGRVIVQPSDEQVAAAITKQQAFEAEKKSWETLIDRPSISKDGHRIDIAANIGTPEDVESVIANGGEGIGLYRTEFLYMDTNKLPSEDEQFEAFKYVLEKMNNQPVVVRTLDIGGDKNIPYLELPEEMNPFLGHRAIRYCLANEDVFRPQLRALLRASNYGNLKIMFPMVATLEEFRKAKSIFEEEKAALLKQGMQVSQSIELGIMVEIPSTALLAKQFAKEVDFFSIGTNDLIQYTMAADRMNEQVSYLYQPHHPAILQLIKNVIDAAHAEGKWVGMCGEMASDEREIPLLLGLGLDEFSMSASSILQTRAQVATLSQQDLAEHMDQILQLATADEVLDYVNNIIM